MAIKNEVTSSVAYSYAPPPVRRTLQTLYDQLVGGAVNGRLGGDRTALIEAAKLGSTLILRRSLQTAEALGFLRPGLDDRGSGWRLTFEDAPGLDATDEYAVIGAAEAERASARLVRMGIG